MTQLMPSESTPDGAPAIQGRTAAEGPAMAAPAGGGIETGWLDGLLHTALRQYAVPGAVCGVLMPGRRGAHPHGDETDCGLDMSCAHAGVVSMATQYPVLPDTLFQIGSISKIWTTVLAMQLIDEGKLSLATRVVDVLPDFSIAGAPDSTKGCTIRHLMCHISGIEGDAFPDLGRDDDAVARYVRYIGGFPARTALGGPLSYSNGAFVTLGRVVEVLRGMTWDEAIQRYIARPMGLHDVCTLPEDVLLHSSALGHHRAVATNVPVFPAPVEPTDIWQLPRCTGPCGSVSCSIHDLLAFASLFLNGGVAPNGARILSADAVRQMLTMQVSLADQGVENLGWALGWQIPNWGSERAVGHGGATEGQRAGIVLFPDRRMVIATLTNADAGTEMAAHIAACIAEYVGLGPKIVPQPVPIADDVIPDDRKDSIIGVYERHGEHIEFCAGGPTGVLAMIDPDDDDGPNGVRLVLPLHRTAQGFYAVRRPDERGLTEIAFLDAADGTHYVACGHRVTPRVRMH